MSINRSPLHEDEMHVHPLCFYNPHRAPPGLPAAKGDMQACMHVRICRPLPSTLTMLLGSANDATILSRGIVADKPSRRRAEGRPTDIRRSLAVCGQCTVIALVRVGKPVWG